MFVILRILKTGTRGALIVSLLLCALAIIFFARSQNRIEGFGYRTHDNQFLQLFSDRGSLCFDRVQSDGDYPLAHFSPLINHRAQILSNWTYSIARPQKSVWGTSDIISSGNNFPYQRWGLSVSPPLKPQTPEDIGMRRLYPAYYLDWRWEDDYVLRQAGARIDSQFDHWGIKSLGGFRYVPVWIDNENWGLVNTQKAKTIAISYGLVIASLIGMCVVFAFFIRALEILRRRRCRQLGLCVFCGYDTRASGSQCSECGSVLAA
jgi:hypothetical protein